MPQKAIALLAFNAMQNFRNRSLQSMRDLKKKIKTLALSLEICILGLFILLIVTLRRVVDSLIERFTNVSIFNSTNFIQP
jgi:hypothetical protein